MHRNSMNKVILVGRVGNDPEKRATQSGRSISNVSLATNEVFRDQSGQNTEQTEWHRCVAFGKTADFINSYVQKGRLLYVEGRLRTRKWTDNNNATHYSTEVMIDSAMLLDRQQNSGDSSIDYSQSQMPSGGGGNYSAPDSFGSDAGDEDLPF